MHDLTRFSLTDMIHLSSLLRGLNQGAGSMEEAARRIVECLHQNLAEGAAGERACALVRFYTTLAGGDLEPGLREFAAAILGEPLSPSTRCLTLLATAGDRPEWNSRHLSARHKAIPLASEQMVESFPMISQLIRQFGLEAQRLLEPQPELILDLGQRTYNVFHVPEAPGSPYVPAQEDFVVRFGIRSVLGFGGVFPTGNLFAVIMFSRVPVPRETADLFRTLALSVKLAVLPFSGGRVFD